jgi:hypothetical protein
VPEDVSFSSYVCVELTFQNVAVPALTSCCSGEVEGGQMNVTLKECPSITKVHAAHRTVKSFFYLHSISEHDKRNVLNL